MGDAAVKAGSSSRSAGEDTDCDWRFWEEEIGDWSAERASEGVLLAFPSLCAGPRNAFSGLDRRKLT